MSMVHFQLRHSIWLILSVVTLLCAIHSAGAGECRFTILDDATQQPVAARIHLLDSQGKPQRAGDLPFWADHFVCEGIAPVQLPEGTYTYTVERGPEFTSERGSFHLGAGPSTNLTIRLKRITNLAQEGWWSGETHVHRKLEHAELLMRAEDLHVAHFITWWNETNPWTNAAVPAPVVPAPVVAFDSNRFYHRLSGEDERGGGALLYLDLLRPLDITKGRRHFPASLSFSSQAREQGARWLDAEKPFWLDLPLWVAHGAVDSIGIAHNHMHRSGVLDNEAWGLARNRAAYPGPHGNALWTQDIYYHLLNCGVRLPPSAGSASGVLPNPVGYNRVYVHVDGEFTYQKWTEGLRAGRSFVSNGPLLRARANGRLPGNVFKSDGPVEIELEGRINSRDPIAAVELVQNGVAQRIHLPGRITIHRSGWFLLRAVADVTNTFRFASTAPWYVEIGNRPAPVAKDSAQFFLDWSRKQSESLRQLRELRVEEKHSVLADWFSAVKFWQEKLNAAARDVLVTGQVVDEATGQPIPARLYVVREDGTPFYPEISFVPAAGSEKPSAVIYHKRNWINPQAAELHTTLSDGAFKLRLEAGLYTITVERGKEYRPLTRQIEVADQPMKLQLPLARWINMAARNWFSGDTHVHRRLEDLPNIALAEDLNVSFPFSYWVTKGYAPPTAGDRNLGGKIPDELIRVDETHLIWPRNTEWEIFTVNGKNHTLGAVFALGHRQIFTNGAPPLAPIAAAVRREGALLDMDKHDWPWAIALVPLLNIDLYELSNNHVWRTEFCFTNWNSQAPGYMGLPNEGRSGGERDWLEYTHRTYWALLNCGFRLRPTAGTATGVHPVPLGFGRVYVHLPQGFSYDRWMTGLNEGRSFVTTGPMLLPRITASEAAGVVLSEEPVTEIEVIINGDIQHRIPVKPSRNEEGAWQAEFSRPLQLDGTSWVALRCWEPRANHRERFAHTAPLWFDLPGQPLRPKKAEAAFLVRRVRDELERSKNVLQAEAIAEYERALKVYEEIGSRAR